MADEIRNSQIFESALFTQEIEKAKKLLSVLDEVEQGFKDVAKAQKEIIENQDNKTIQSVNKTKTAIKELNDVERSALKVQQQKKKLVDQLNVANKTQSRTNAVLRQQIILQNKANREAAKETLKLVSSYEKLVAKTKLARKSFRDLAATEGLTSKATTKARIEFQKLDAQLGRINRRVQSSNGLFSRLGGTLRSGLGFLGLASGVAVVGGAFIKAGKTIGDFDEGVADIAKVTGLAKEEARELANELLKIDTRTSVNELLELATAGGRLGLTGRTLIDFVESTDKAFVALGDTLEGSAEDIGVSLGKIASVFGIEAEFGIAESINKIGSSLNDLGAKSKANEGRIQDFTRRLAGVGVQAGLSIPEVQALGAFFDEAGQSVEVSASTLNKLLPAIGKDTKKFAKIAGQDIKEFEKLVTEKPLEALKAVARGAKSSEKGLIGLSKTLKNYGIDSSRAAGIVGILSEKTDRLTELQLIANEAFEAGTSLADEFAIKNETLAAKVEKFGNNVDKLVLSLEDGNGILARFFSGMIDGANEALVVLTKIDNAFGKFIDRSIGARESLSLALTEFQTGGADPASKLLNEIQKNIETTTDEIAKDFIAKDLKTQKIIANNLVKRIKADNKLLKDASFFESFNIERRINANILLLEKLKDVTKVREEDNEVVADSIKQGKKLIGIINNQEKAVSDLAEKIKEATTEKQILKLSIEFDIETEELKRLKRIVSSSLKEIDKIERDLIEDASERRIAQEIAKSEKLIKQIEDNSRIELSKKEELIKLENERLARFINKEEIKEGKKRIKLQSDLAKAEFEQRRTGFNSQEEFEKEKAEQFKAIRRKAIEDEIKLIEQFGGAGSDLRIKQLNAELEGLADIGKGFKDLQNTVGDVVEVIGEMIDDAFEKRIENIGESIDKTGENIDRLRDKAAEGQLSSEESLAFEQKQEAELEQQRIREQKRQERTKAFFAVLSSFQANDGNLGKTIADISVLRSLAQGLTAFDGVDDTGGRGNVDSKGGKIWTIHPHEQIDSLQDRKDKADPKTGRLRSRQEIKNIVKMHDSGTLNDLMAHDKSHEFMNPSAFVLNGLGNSDVIAKLDQLNDSINSMEFPENNFDYDIIRKIFTHARKVGNKTTITKSKLF